MKVLITGGAGFIGSNLSRILLESDSVTELRVLDDLSTGSLQNIRDMDVEFIEGTILNYDRLVKASVGMDSIVHLGAVPSVPRSISDPRTSHYANTTGTLNVLEAARHAGVEHVIVASSSSVYGSNPVLPKSEKDYTRPLSPYAVSKLATEGYALAYQAAYGLKTLAFRFFNVYGPNQAADHAYAAVIPRFLDAAIKGKPVQIQGDGRQSRDFTYVATVCDVIHQAIRRQVQSTAPVNLAYGTNTTLLTLLEQMETQLGHPIKRDNVAARIGDVRASQADNALVRELFPEIEPVALEEGLQKTIDWFRDK